MLTKSYNILFIVLTVFILCYFVATAMREHYENKMYLQTLTVIENLRKTERSTQNEIDKMSDYDLCIKLLSDSNGMFNATDVCK